MTRFLRSLKYSTLLFQETSISRPNQSRIIDSLNLQLQSKQTIWSHFCGIVNFNENFNIECLKQAEDERYILALITMPEEPSFQPIYLLNIYAPASNAENQRNLFFEDLINMIHSMHESHPNLINNMILAGDFNFCLDSHSDHHTRRGTLPHALVRFLGVHMHDCINDSLHLTARSRTGHVYGRAYPSRMKFLI